MATGRGGNGTAGRPVQARSVATRTALLDAAIDLVWSMFEGPTFVAWIELWIAARTDPDLAEAVTAMDLRFTTESRALFLELFPPDDTDDGNVAALYDIGRDFAFAWMTGVALQRLVPRGQRPATDYLDALKRMFRLLLAEPEPGAGRA